MATRQQPSFDFSRSVVMAAAPRGVARRQDYVEPARTITNQKDSELAACAHLEATNWVARRGKKRLPEFEEKWNKAKAAMEVRLKAVSDLSSVPQERLATHDKVFRENLSVLQQSLIAVTKSVDEARYLPQIVLADGSYRPRAYAAVTAYLHAVHAEFDERTFNVFFDALQHTVPLEMSEIWKLRSLMELALLEDVVPFVAISADSASSTITELTAASLKPCSIVSGNPKLSSLIASLRRIADADWKVLFEQINRTEQILRQDPCGAYSRMDFETREAYRQTITALSKRCASTEQAIAEQALAFAKEAITTESGRATERQAHVGYYLVGDGKNALKQAIGYRSTWTERAQSFIRRWPDFSYILGIELLTFALMALAFYGSHLRLAASFMLVLFLLPAAECAVTLINQLVTSMFPPVALPKLDFSRGIPRDFTTMVVVPTLLTSERQMKRAVKDLEIRFLANRDANLHFALLSDPPDSAQQFDEKDNLAGQCAALIEALNEKYSADGKGSFFLFHRHRAYNPSEGVWMAWERKRGKLLDFNNLLLGKSDNFPVKTGDSRILKNVKYVITLDLDTQLPRNSARRLVGAIAHPLNRAVVDPATNTVTHGYGILQPRVDISIQSANRSRLAAIFSADAGFDIYTRAVSDVYQDLFGEGSFTGKGIYEVSVFQQVLDHRFPCNTILSHDMIEGAYTRAGLVSDVEVIDDYPSHMSAYSRRKHRWVRGDWQIVFWLLPRVPDFFGKIVRNPLSVISRWKIIDNLRRSLTEMGTFIMLLAGWLFFPSKAFYWTVATLAVVALPVYSQFVFSILRAKKALFTSAFWKNLAGDFALAHANLFMRLVCLCHQSLVTVDAVVRAIVRMTVTHERLLEWETADEAELTSTKKNPVETYLELTPWLAFFVGLFLAVDRPESFPIALPILILWCLSKPIEQWLNLPSQPVSAKLSGENQSKLRLFSLRTWRLFRQFSTAAENWLVPDTVQHPDSLIVHRISTTNLGLLLNSRLAAVDLGFLTVPEFVENTEGTFDAVDRMPKLQGQMYNWYDTQTLEAVKPRFISTVDNGNLICSLWTLKQGCLETISTPVFRPELWLGIQDQLDTIAELLVEHKAEESFLARIAQLKQHLQEVEKNPATWSEQLPQLHSDVAALGSDLRNRCQIDEIAWWVGELSARIAQLNNLVRDFAPWLAPQFFLYCQRPEVVKQLRPEKLTLQSLPAACDSLDRLLQDLLFRSTTTDEDRATLIMLRAMLNRSAGAALALQTKLAQLAERADRLAKSMDFAFLYDAKKKLLTIGYNAEESHLTSSHYDLLASEARASVFVAIAKGEIPQEAWFTLKRPYTEYEHEHALLSWSGTMFEYLMPFLWMKFYPNTILEHSARAALRCQKKFASLNSIPWGISEASCAKLNPDGHYHYEAFGVPGLAVFKELSRDLVVSPYSTFLSLIVDANGGFENLQKMKDLGWLGAYGFYESVDFTASRMNSGRQFEVVPCWLAHHQGMSLMSAANVLCDSSMQRRFHAEPLVAATERLLHEKAPRASEVSTSEKESSLEGESKQKRHNQNSWAAPSKAHTAN
ncbi:MAG TPA: glucoamylase family protein [Candidatus Acidoferrum sp.]|jgi:hypothetical protein